MQTIERLICVVIMITLLSIGGCDHTERIDRGTPLTRGDFEDYVQLVKAYQQHDILIQGMKQYLGTLQERKILPSPDDLGKMPVIEDKKG